MRSAIQAFMKNPHKILSEPSPRLDGSSFLAFSSCGKKVVARSIGPDIKVGKKAT